MPPIFASPDLIEQMMDKLIANAVDFADDETPIEVALRPVNRGVQITVTNYGSRLPDGLKTVCSSPWCRCETAVRKTMTSTSDWGFTLFS